MSIWMILQALRSVHRGLFCTLKLKPSSCFSISPLQLLAHIFYCDVEQHVCPLNDGSWDSSHELNIVSVHCVLMKKLVVVQWSTHRSDCAPLTEGSWPAEGCR